MDHDNESIKLSNTTPYQVLVISSNSITDRDWSDPLYLKTLLNDSFCKYELIDPKEYVKCIATLLNIKDYAFPSVKTNIISESTEYIDEIMYIDVFPEYKIDELKNECATLLNINGDIIYGNAIISRTCIPSNDDINIETEDKRPSMFYSDVTSINLEQMMHNRINTRMILYDSNKDEYIEREISGSLDIFANEFFGKSYDSIKKHEIGFLKHNINIWYSSQKEGKTDVFGNIFPESTCIDKMIVFTMWCENYRGNITLDEFNKIKFLSKHLVNYNTPDDMTIEKEDDIGRLIIKNKYRVLNTVYNMYKK